MTNPKWRGAIVDRRTMLGGVATAAIAPGVAASPLAKGSAKSATPAESETLPIPAGERGWLGPNFWANRLQDWHARDGWIECRRGEKGMEGRTVAILTHELVAGGSARIEADIAADTSSGRGGFGGFLIGVGEGKLDYLAAAMAQRGSGAAGGIFAVTDCDGRPAFRDHRNDQQPLAFAELDATRNGIGSADLASRPAKLVLEIEPGEGRFARLRLSLGEQLVATETIPDELLRGGIALVSSTPTDAAGARFRFTNIKIGGSKIAVRSERSMGPCLGTLYSVANGVMKMSAHFTLIGKADNQQAELQVRTGKGGWKTIARAPIGDGACALFRAENWDASRNWQFRLLYALNGKAAPVWSGTIRADPVASGKPVVIGMQGCVLSTQHALESNIVRRIVPQERQFGRYQPENFNFPHRDIANNCAAHDPDLVFYSGDQYYEQNPTRVTRGQPDILIDTLGRWQQWLVSFAALSRNRPSIVLVDDHDVLHGNLWGNGGRDAPDRDQNRGGYAWGRDLSLMVYRMQCGHNPDPDDPTPVENGLPVSYGAFLYGGVSFAIIEDRKWKTSAEQGQDMDVHVAHLLGDRQEAFLAKWKDMHPGAPKVLLTQSQWGCLQTNPDGRPLLDFDSNSYPPLARRRAIELAAATGCIMLAGDQHLPSVVRHGIDRFDDGPVQFTGPAGGTFWQRWFEPQPLLANQRDGNPLTGDFRDAFGHPMRVLAVANPTITFKEFRKHSTGRDQIIADRALKSEGYGIVRVDHNAAKYDLECWRWNKGPESGADGQYSGWPVHVPFTETGRG